MESSLVKWDEFLAVRHSVLNGNTYKVDQLVEDTLRLEKYVHGRAVVPCFEGDLLQVRETGEIVFTHQNFLPLTQKMYRNLKENKLAAPIEEVLDKIAAYQQEKSNPKVVLCFEPKLITHQKTINNAIGILKEYNIKDVYFDSFYGGKLDYVSLGNQFYRTDYSKSLHLVGNIATSPIMMSKPKDHYDILTVPHAMSLGDINQPVIYGAVGSTHILEKIAQNPLVKGAYVRLSEGAGLKGAIVKLFNSVTNTKKLRQKHLVNISRI